MEPPPFNGRPMWRVPRAGGDTSGIVPAKDAHPFRLTGQQIKPVVFEEPAKLVAFGIPFQKNRTGKPVGGKYQNTIIHIDLQFGVRKNEAPIEVNESACTRNQPAVGINELCMDDISLRKLPIPTLSRRSTGVDAPGATAASHLTSFVTVSLSI